MQALKKQNTISNSNIKQLMGQRNLSVSAAPVSSFLDSIRGKVPTTVLNTPIAKVDSHNFKTLTVEDTRSPNTFSRTPKQPLSFFRSSLPPVSSSSRCLLETPLVMV